jgi:hypothetical protein
MRMRKLAFVLLLAACGPSSSEVKTARLATYQASPQDILHIAMDAARGEHYDIGDIQQDKLEFITAPRFYTKTGDLESPGAEGWVNVRPGSVEVMFIVRAAVVDSGRVAVQVTPKTFQAIAGSPKPRELAPDDPYLPPWVLGRADALQIAIYQRARPYALAPPEGK